MTSNPTCESVHQTKLDLCDLLDKHKKVYFTRFGDGDMYILMGRNQANHRFNPALAKELSLSLRIEDPLYLRGHVVNYPIEKEMTKGLFLPYKLNDEMADFLKDEMDFPDSQPLYNSWFPNFYASFRPKELVAFLDHYVRPKRKMFIGSVPKEQVEQLFGKIDYHVQTPRKNAFEEMDQWWQEVLRHIDDVEMVLPAVGMASRVINLRLWELDKQVHCLDLGSIVDAASSFPSSRTWIRLKGHVVNRILLPEYHDNSPSYWFRYAFKEIKLFFRKLFYKVDPFAHVPFIRKARIYHPGAGKRFS